MIIKSTRSDDIEFKFSNVGLKFLYFFIILILFLLLKVTWNYCAVSWTLEKNKCVNHMYIEAVQFVVNCIPKRIWSAIAFTRKLSNKCLFMWYRRSFNTLGVNKIECRMIICLRSLVIHVGPTMSKINIQC